MKSRATSLFLLLAGSLIPSTSFAEEGVYESLADVKIGRIFLSPSERISLDNQRGKAPALAIAAKPAVTARATQSPDAAGYILRSGGPTRVWSNGNFVPAEDASDVTFPGDVEVLRKAVPEQESNRGAADDAS